MTVYLVQDASNRNFLPAAKYGEIVPIMPEVTQVVFSAAPALRKLRQSLSKFNDEDYLLLSGDPVLIGLAITCAALANNGKVRVLKWDKQEKTYFPVEVDFYEQ